jgi:hypothetical protein
VHVLQHVRCRCDVTLFFLGKGEDAVEKQSEDD